METFRFAIISDPHIALPETIDPTAHRFHLVEVSQAAFNRAIAHLETLDLDFLLIPGDLTQDGETENHHWLQHQLRQLPFPIYVIPGNHDVPLPQGSDRTIGLDTFPHCYSHCGYQHPEQIYYSQEVFSGVQLIGLNSNNFDKEGQQIGHLDSIQLEWLETELKKYPDRLILLTIHHNVIEHLPAQSEHELGRRYMLDNAKILLNLLKKYQVKLIFTGHLHVQDIAHQEGIYEITTGSLVSYPHPYRLITCRRESESWYLDIQSHRIESVDDFPNLAEQSRQFLGDRSYFFMMRLLTLPPLNLPKETAEKFVPDLRYFWADVAEGDGQFDFPSFPEPLRLFLQHFGRYNHPAHLDFQDNNTTLVI